MSKGLLVAMATILLSLFLGLLVGQHRQVAQLRGLLQHHESGILRQQTMDRSSSTVATEIQARWLDSVFAGTDGSRRILWIVDATRCPGCLSDLSAWNRLQADTDWATLVVIDGTTSEGAKRIAAQAGLAGPFLNGDGHSQSVFGVATPSTRLVFVEDTLVLVDGRYPEQACSWTAEEVVLQLSRELGE